MSFDDLPAWIPESVIDATGKRPVHFRVIPNAGGYSNVVRRVVEFSDGTSGFVKASVSELTAKWIDKEAGLYGMKAPYMLELLGHASSGLSESLLVLENAEGADWPPPWNDQRIGLVTDLLEEVRTTPPPKSLHPLENLRVELPGWELIADDPQPFLSLGLASQSWLEKYLALFRNASENAALAGDAFVHFDVRSDNLCFFRDRACLVDWNWTSIGNADVDQHLWAMTLANETGRCHEELLKGAASGHFAFAVGYWAAHAGLPADEGAPAVRAIQLAILKANLPWACRLLAFEPPL